MSELRLDGRVAIVTGGGRGLGRCHARLLASRGARVVVNDPGVALDGSGHDNAPAASVVEDIIADGGQAIANFGDVSREADADALVAAALTAFGSVDIVVNNAGVFVPGGSFERTTTESFTRLFAVHVMGTVNVSRAAWPHMKQRSYGRIINTVSTSGYLGAPGMFEYATAKMAVHGLTRVLSFAGGEVGIAVNAIAPGARTRPVADHYPDFPETQAFAPELVSPTVAWLAHETCTVNGEVFGVVAGTTSRITIAETQGITSQHPTPELIRDGEDRILDQEALDRSGLVFAHSSVQRGADLIALYESAGQWPVTGSA